MEDPIIEDVIEEELFEDSDLSTETAEDFKTKDSNIAWKWVLWGCGGGLLAACLLCFSTMAILWYTGDALVEWLMGL